MKPRFSIGLVVGIIGLVLNSCVSTFTGNYGGLIVFLMMGGIAGFFAAQREKPITKQGGTAAGIVAGSIAGILITFGQIIASILTILFTPITPAEITSPDASYQFGYELFKAAIITICLGFPLAAAISACVGYLITPKQK